MFGHIFVYRLKVLLRDKITIFWTIMFPIVLAVFFQLALSNIGNGDAFQPIDIAVVDDSNYKADESLGIALEEASKGEDRLFNLNVVTEDEAKRLLDEGLIKGYIEAGSTGFASSAGSTGSDGLAGSTGSAGSAGLAINLVVKDSGLSQNIIKSYLDNYTQTVAAATTIISSNPAKAGDVLSSIANRENYIKEVSATASEPNAMLNYFYSLVAMACFYGGFLGIREISDIQADISPLAARINAAPVHKLKTFLYSMSATLLIHIFEMFALLAFLRFVLNIDFGLKSGYVILTTILGSFAGVLMGAFVSAIVKKAEGLKVAILLTISMGGSFLAGMMYQDMKYIVAQKAPLISYLNPINLLTDAFYCRYYYDDLSRYLINIIVLLGFIVILGLGTHLIVRRQKYASL